MTTVTMDREPAPITPSSINAQASGVSWAAILAGALGAAALSLILVVLGTGLGFSVVSPWSQEGVGATAFGVSTILWLTFVQIVASGTGGYLAGRLRHRFVATPVDEVYFRDTAHGFLAWALATLVTAAVLSTVIGAVVGGVTKAGAAVATSAGTAAVAGGVAASGHDGGGGVPGMGYTTDSLLRRDPSATMPADPNVAGSTAEIARIFAQGLQSGSLPPDDQRYVTQLVAQKTGLSPDDAGKRVQDAFARIKAATDTAATQAREAAATAKKAASYGALWLFVSLLSGAFVASLAATYGGRRRDL